ncbi:hypothetical protein N0V87_009033 [Didymella glomerata]|uniref:Uncharacterized protein n=1 Tax=Didymella glomerata TaxID=749621 RepID=A0A9W8WRW7_9PLEO|nr:hypothetical protein N0V87_009033 [Didymella glomerata]
MLEETEMFDHLEDGGISAILVDSADDGLQGAGDHLCGHNGACVAVDKGINAMISHIEGVLASVLTASIEPEATQDFGLNRVSKH